MDTLGTVSKIYGAAMPTLEHTVKVYEYLHIGVRFGSAVKDKKDKGVWWARIKFPRQSPVYLSTKIPYDNGSAIAKHQAQQEALKLFDPYKKKLEIGKPINHVFYIHNLLDEYCEEVEEHTKENEKREEQGLEPIRTVIGGRGYWNIRRLRVHRTCTKYLREFFKTIRTNPAELRYAIKGAPQLKDIASCTKRDWDKLDTFLLERYSHLSKETRLRVNTILRNFLHWCYEKEYIDEVVSVKRPARGGVLEARKRMRREITPQDYRRMIEYTREKYLDKGQRIYTGFRHYQYLFHLWILILANTGIRPPTSGLKSTLMRWEHVDFNDPERPILHRPNEKLHNYEALIMPAAWDYFQALVNFYDDLGMPTDKGYVFAHPVDKDPSTRQGFRRGDPIYGFRKQWVRMVEDLGLAKAGAPQSERVSPSSLRAWFITQRLYAATDKGERIDILQLARATGTSVSQIEARYARLETRRGYEHLTAGGYYPEKKASYEEIEGVRYYTGHR